MKDRDKQKKNHQYKWEATSFYKFRCYKGMGRFMGRQSHNLLIV